MREMRLKWCVPAFAAGVMAAVPGRAMQAQVQAARRELVGVVRDSTGAPIEGATIEIPGAAGRSDARGAFQLWTADIDTLTISIRRLGYAPISAFLTARNRQWDTVAVEMDQTSRRLAAIAVTGATTRGALGLRDFDRRRALGNGVFITRDEIAARNTSRPSDVLQTKRGIRLVRIADGRYGVRFALYGNGNRSQCVPTIWVDGQRAPGMEIDDLTANDIQAMELYETFASTPSQFTSSGGRTPPCGTIVVWTRVPGL